MGFSEVRGSFPPTGFVCTLHHPEPALSPPQGVTKRAGQSKGRISVPAHPVLHGWEGPWLGLQDSTFRILLSHPSIASSPINHGTFTVQLLRLVTSQRQSQASRQGLRACQTQSPEKQRRTEIFRGKKKVTHHTALTGEAFEEVKPTRTSCTFPFSMTRTRSQLRTVFRRWAMVNTVQLLKASFIVL